ncbi:O-antigen ligase family protein [Micromonospora sp. LAH09]|uniref:O-antigen ligase family protein n=1 Tax=Micromonospora cabrerizensis TaxID=2911213 RepID=UPI001EE7935F|nr:O-antigen ligase family protein [Micromonospora cabrerizensis]MCG5468187.1 O-antigen ligase family protein [Micromonospora cabrerizensis]
MRVPIVAPTVLLGGAGLGGLVTVVTLLPGPIGLAAAVAVLSWGVFLLWPWAVLPVGIVGGAVVGALLSGGDVRGFIAVKVLLLATGGAALALRHWLRVEAPPRRTAADLGMLGLIGLTVVAAIYGLAVGNLPTEVLVAAYQVATIPVYFFVATHTLTTPRRVLAAGVLYVVLAAAFTAISVAAPGRHGGLITLMAIPALIWVAGRLRGWRRNGVLLLGGFFAVDVLLASYRGIWLAAALTLLIMLVRGGRTVRTGLAATAVAAVAVASVLALQPGVRERAGEITKGFQQSAGYRGVESSVGLNVFADQPLVGAGLGQTTPDIYLSGFTFTDVGPVYHAFYVTVLANLGLVGLLLVLWPILRSILVGLRGRDGITLPFAALSCGFLAAAVFAAPTDGHWELGLLPALTLLTAQQDGERLRRLAGAPLLRRQLHRTGVTA